MGVESTPNEFRAARRAKRSESPVAKKPKRRAPKGEGLGEDQAVLRRNGRQHVVELINLSHGGAMVAGEFKAKLWDMVALVLGVEGQPGPGEVECAVRWIRDGRYGLEFAHETQIECDSETLDELLREVIRHSFPGVDLTLRPSDDVVLPEKRAAVRHPLIWNGILHHGYEWEVARLRNISQSGALIECPANLPVGAAVQLDLSEAGKIGATVNWSRCNQSGLSFHKPFDVRSLAKAAPDVATKHGYQAPFGELGQSDQSPWAPQWGRLSVDELGKQLGG